MMTAPAVGTTTNIYVYVLSYSASAIMASVSGIPTNLTSVITISYVSQVFSMSINPNVILHCISNLVSTSYSEGLRPSCPRHPALLCALGRHRGRPSEKKIGIPKAGIDPTD